MSANQRQPFGRKQRCRSGGWLIWCCLLPLIVGCEGCRPGGGEDPETDLKEQLLPPFTMDAAQAFPATRVDAGTRGAKDGSVKPGHWSSAGLSLRSNREDQRGIIETRAKIARPSDVFSDSDGPETSGEIEARFAAAAETAVGKSFRVRRPAVLPKGQRRQLETRLLAPEAGGMTMEGVNFNGDFVPSRGGGKFPLRPSVFAALPPQSYFFVVLTDRAERFTRLQTADWIDPIRGSDQFYRPRENYRIVIPPTEGVLPLSETALDWTSTSILFWDNLPSSALTPGQRTALVDWLHFGGTLIVNGNAAADAIDDPTIGPLLPIRSDGNTELEGAKAVAFLKSHQVATDESIPAIAARLTDDNSSVAVAGQAVGDAIPLGDGDLVYQRRVGRGRIVQSRVDLLSEWMTAWKSDDSLFNYAVLGRPPRKIRALDSNLGSPGYQELLLGQQEPDTVVEEELLKAVVTPSFEQQLIGMTVEDVPPSINTGVRFFSRDMRLGVLSGSNGDSSESSPEPTVLASTPSATYAANDYRRRLEPEVLLHPVSGVGGWKDDSPLLTLFRQTLREQVGVTIPKSSLVVKSLLVYLLVLIPLNYLVFRLLGKLEWAWLAVIPIAIIGAFLVARAAQLDVGFARSRNELALLEIPRDYSRGHLTRVIALYNSLASDYSVQFDTPDAAITLLASGQADSRNQSLFGDDSLTMQVGFEAGPRLDGMAVSSNSFGALHVEQMVPVGGAITLAADAKTVRNDSDLILQDVFVLRRTADTDGTQVAFVGGLSPGEKPTLEYKPVEEIRVPDDIPDGARDCLQRMIASRSIPVGSTRLIGRLAAVPETSGTTTDEQPAADAELTTGDGSAAWGGLELTPRATQVTAQTVVLVHLEMPATAEPLPDENLVGDFRRRQTELKPAEKDKS